VSSKDPRRTNTIAMLGQAYSLLGFRIVDGVVGAGYPQKPNYSAVFAQIRPEGARLTQLAAGANMTPQAMGEIVDEMEEIGYVVRRPDPADRRAKLIILTPRGVGAVKAGEETIVGIEQELIDRLGDADYRSLQRILVKLAEVPRHRSGAGAGRSQTPPSPR